MDYTNQIKKVITKRLENMSGHEQNRSSRGWWIDKIVVKEFDLSIVI